MDIFNKLPIVSYEGQQASNLLVRAELFRKIVKQKPAFYDYLIKDGERPDTIAYDYYGSEDYAWLVILCANTFNFYSDWPKTYEEFKRYLVTKYGSIEHTMATIDHYVYEGIGGDPDERINRVTWTLTPNTFDALTTEEKNGWRSVTIYQAEDQLNESRRRIKLLSKIYLDQVDTELQALFNGS